MVLHICERVMSRNAPDNLLLHLVKKLTNPCREAIERRVRWGREQLSLPGSGERSAR